MKSDMQLAIIDHQVAPHAGAWIEINGTFTVPNGVKVAPHAGAWIEMIMILSLRWNESSHPTRVRGLK